MRTRFGVIDLGRAKRDILSNRSGADGFDGQRGEAHANIIGYTVRRLSKKRLWNQGKWRVAGSILRLKNEGIAAPPRSFQNTSKASITNLIPKESR